jgi:Domain of unknown function (DUF4911)
MEDDAREARDGPPVEMATMMLRIPPARIALFKAIIESYDNLATLRTDDPQTHRLKLYFAPESADEVEALVERLTGEFELDRIG